MADNLKDQMKSFFTDFGIIFDKDQEYLDRLLRHQMRNACRKIDHMHAKVDEGQAEFRSNWAWTPTARASNVLISFWADAFLRGSHEVYSAIKPLLKPGVRIADMGCFTGALAAWLATNHPECKVFGIDGNPKAIEFARELTNLPNASFVQWDYAGDTAAPIEACDILVSTLGIEFCVDDDFSWKCSLDTKKLRESEFCRRRTAEVLPYFTRWREACKPDGQLLAVLRVKNIDHDLSIVEAAHRAGWTFDTARSALLLIGGRLFRLMRFAARESQQPSDAEIMASWQNQNVPPQAGQFFDFVLAVVVYESLADKCVLVSDDRRIQDGHAERVSVGIAGDIGFIFERSTTGYAELKLISLSQVNALLRSGIAA